MATTGNFIASYDIAVVTLTNADGTTVKDLIAPSGNDIHVHGISVASDDTSAIEVQLWSNDGTTDGLLTTKSIPAGAGNSDAVVAESLLDEAHMPALDSSPGRFLTVGDGEKLRIGAKTAVTSAKTIWVTVFYGAY